MSKFKEVDFYFTDDGDFSVDEKGDLKDTSGLFGRAILQEINDRLRSQPGEWKLSNSIGTNLQQYLGVSTTDQNIDLVTKQVEAVLTNDGLLVAGQLEILPLKIGDSVVIFRVIVYTGQEELVYHLGYDSDHQRFLGE